MQKDYLLLLELDIDKSIFQKTKIGTNLIINKKLFHIYRLCSSIDFFVQSQKKLNIDTDLGLTRKTQYAGHLT